MSTKVIVDLPRSAAERIQAKVDELLSRRVQSEMWASALTPLFKKRCPHCGKVIE